MTEHPRTLFIETTTRCNLACPMCVKNAPGWRGGCGDMAPALFARLDEPLRHARAVILNGMGEPLLHPDLPRFIAQVKERQPDGGWCGMQTNGLLLDAALARELAAAGLDVLCLSCDGDAAAGQALGHGAAQGEAVARAVGLLRAAGRRLRLGLETVLMRSSVRRLPELVDWAAGLGLDFMLASHLLPADPRLEGEGLFHPCSGAALQLFARWRAEALSQGLDLAEVPQAAMKFRRSPAEDRLLALARDMHEEAHARGLWLNLGRLARTDFAELAELEALFAEARARAAASGLDLALPGLAAPEDPAGRRCAFMEDAAAFIDWQGRVSPCHFLWHGYECRVFGEKKRVYPQHFGSIAEAPLADIWAAPDYAAFRRAAASGEYPACGDCDLGVCSDACGAAGPFEQDCLGVAVPCGHCPWAVGQLMCLGAAGV